MDKDKRVPNIAVVIIIALLTVVTCIILACTAGYSKDTDLKEPEYMSRLFDKDKVLEINIDIDENNFEDLKKNATDEKYYKADITIDGTTFKNIGIRAKGNSSLSQVASDDTTDRYSFKIKADEYIDNQSIYGLSKFVLNNNIGDATNMKEYMSYDLLNNMGISTPGFAYANIKINNEEWGLYLAVESLEEEFINRNYGNSDGNLYKVETMNMGKEMNGGMKEKMKEANQQMENGEGQQMPEPGENGEPPQRNDGVPMNNGEGQQMTGPGGDGEPPQGNNGAPMNNGEGQQMTGPGGNGEPPQGNNGAPMNNGEGQQMQSPDADNEGNGDQKQGGPGGPPGGNGNGGNLVYTDDNISSYSSIFDYTIFDRTNKSDKKRLINSIKNLNDGTNLEDSIDVDEVLRYFAVNTFLVNLDSYAGSLKHNYYIYENDGKMQILPWDYNLAYGAFFMQGPGMGKGQQGNNNDADSENNSKASKVINFPIDTPVTDTMDNSPLISKLLEVDEYKEKYHEYLQEIVDKYVNTGYFDEEIDKVDNLISAYVENDPTAFFTYDEYKASIPHLKQYGVDRAESILKQLEGVQPSDDYGNVETTVDIDALGSQMGAHKDGDHQGGMPGMSENGEEGQGNKKMMPPGMQNQQEENNIKLGGMSIPVSTAVTAVCFIVMIIAVVFAGRFRRKRIYCK